jgi:hypothetical protein
VNHRIGFVDQVTGAHTNIIESYWHHLKVYVDPYCRKKGYLYQFAHYMFAARCKADNVDPFTMFLHIVAGIDWSAQTPSSCTFCSRDLCHLYIQVIAHS